MSTRYRKRRLRPNPYAITVGERVTWADRYPTSDGGRRPIIVHGVVIDIEWKQPWPDGMVYIEVDHASLPEECWELARSKMAVPLESVRPDRRRAM